MSLQITVTEAVTNITSNDAVTIISEQIAGVQGPKGDTGATGATGVQGPKGDTGATGPANSLSIGTVTSGTAGATITGTAPSQTLNLTLPIASFVVKGAWANGTAYNQYDVVTNNGKTWYAKINTAANVQPLIDSVNWGFMSFGYTPTVAWTSGNFYYPGDTVTDEGSTYYATGQVSTSGDRGTQPKNLPSKWLLIASKGDTGATGAAGQWGNYFQLSNDLVYSTSPGFGVGNDWNPFSTSSKTFGLSLPAGTPGTQKYYQFIGEFKLSGPLQSTSHALSFAINGSNIDNLDGTYSLDRTTTDYKTSPPVGNNATYRRHADTVGVYQTLEAAVTTQQYRYVRVQGFFRHINLLTAASVYPSFRWISAAETPTIYAGSYLNVVEVGNDAISGNWYKGSWS